MVDFASDRPDMEEGASAPTELDELYDEAVGVVMSTGQASVSMLQRRLSVGYARAGRLIEAMEREGVVGPHRGSKAREILVKNTSDWEPE